MLCASVNSGNIICFFFGISNRTLFGLMPVVSNKRACQYIFITTITFNIRISGWLPEVEIWNKSFLVYEILLNFEEWYVYLNYKFVLVLFGKLSHLVYATGFIALINLNHLMKIPVFCNTVRIYTPILVWVDFLQGMSGGRERKTIRFFWIELHESKKWPL